MGVWWVIGAQVSDGLGRGGVDDGMGCGGGGNGLGCG